jgi:V/A-type H+-transporting ATPase subunit K
MSRGLRVNHAMRGHIPSYSPKSGLLQVILQQPLRLVIAFTVLAALLAGGMGAILLVIPPAAAQTGATLSMPPDVWKWGLICAVFATAVSSAAAAYAVAKTGSAAIGAIAEKPELFGRLVIYVGLAEGIAIYGLIVSILIINRLA